MVGTIHRYETNEETGKLMCPYCDYQTQKGSTISEHVRQKHPQNAERPVLSNICPHADCGRSFQTKSELRHHINSKTHQTEETAAFACGECGDRFSKKSAMITHFVRVHLPHETMMTQIGEDSKCEHCSKVMKTSSMSYHVGVCHPVSPFSKNYNPFSAASIIAEKKDEPEPEVVDSVDDVDDDDDVDLGEFMSFIQKLAAVKVVETKSGDKETTIKPKMLSHSVVRMGGTGLKRTYMKRQVKHI